MTSLSGPGGNEIVAILEGAKAPTTVPRMPKRKSPSGGGWRDGWQRDDRGQPISNLANAMHALRNDSALAGMLAFDLMQGAVILNHPVPSPAEPDALPDDDFRPRTLCDNDLSRLQEYLQVRGLMRLSRDTTHQAAEARANEGACAFHPVRQFLEDLTWDGVPRLGTWLHTYLGSDDGPYQSEIGAMFLIASVARVFAPGCKADYMVVLEGEQGAMKSTVCRILGGHWFSDNMPPVTAGKDVSLHLRGKWFIEIPELSAMSRAEDEELKAFITRPMERFRPPYGRTEVEMPRQCVFMGTTNKSDYLRDETGGRRYWPVKVGRIDVDALQRDREQLFAEALHLYRAGRRWWPDADFERKYIKPQQEERLRGDAWEDSISEWLTGKSRVTVGNVASYALGIEIGKVSHADQLRIIACLARLGWIRGTRTGGGRWYVRHTDTPHVTG